MKNTLKKIINSLFDKFGYILIKKTNYANEVKFKKIDKFLKYLLLSDTKHTKQLIYYFSRFTSQLMQDLFVLDQLKFKKRGYFVEFGAADGVNLSNSYILEKEFDWQGIVAEPSKGWHKSLKNNRGCFIDERCVWSVSGEKLMFSQVEVNELSTLSEFESSDSHNRENNEKYLVETISLSDLLREYDAPKFIDYISIDTEGSELKILKSFDFDYYKVKLITVEHNYTSQREQIYDFLVSIGYKRVFQEISEFDDWYILET